MNAVMDALGARLQTISGLRVFDYPPDQLSPPAAVVSYPEGVTYDVEFARGADMATFIVTVLVGRVSERSARDALAPYLNGSGASSVKAAIDGTLGGVVSDARVASADVMTVSMNGAEYVGAAFTVEVLT